MKSAVLYEYGKDLSVEQVSIGEPGIGEVLVKMKASGVCHSDYHVIKGDYPHIPLPNILGHEGAGIVEQVGKGVDNINEGDHVILTWKPGCGRCEMCQQGWISVCDNFMPSIQVDPVSEISGKNLNKMVGLGTFAEFSIVPQSSIVKIEKDIPFPQAALIGCGVTTGVCAVTNSANVRPGTSVAVFGCGGVGLNVIQGARIASATTIIAVDILDNKLELARNFGATHTVNASQVDPVDEIIKITDGEGAHYAFEAIGLIPGPFEQSVMCTRKRGITVWLGAAPFETNVSLDARALFTERTIKGAYYGSSRPHIDFHRMIDLYKNNLLKIDELISNECSIDDINHSFNLLKEGQVARSVIVYD